jgi:CRISPR-associated endonuclease Csn1
LKEVSFHSFGDGAQDETTRQRLRKLERYIKMQPHFTTAEVEQAVAGIAVSFKGGKRVATTGKRYIYKGGKRVLAQQGIIIPRGALSEESVYGRIKNQETGKYDYVIKYKVGQIALKDVEYVVDKRIRDILRERLEQFGGKPEKAFAEPIFDHQGREIRSVRCRTGLSATVPLRYNKHNEPSAFVKPANNHHVAIYEDENGKWQEHIVTFWHAVERKKYGVPVIISDTAELWENITKQMPQSFLNQLPESAKWQLKFSMQQNEMFILGMEEELYQDAMKNNDYATLSKYLYRVQNISAGAYVFRKHIETQTNDNYPDENGKLKFNLIKSIYFNCKYFHFRNSKTLMTTC